MQKETFLKSEGNEYYHRNAIKHDPLTVPSHLKIFTKYVKPGSKVLEIGCSDGHKLVYLYKNGCECYGIDPSSDAIETGKSLYEYLNLSVGTANKLNFPDNFFDLVIFGFCLYVVDRSDLFKIMAETDRVLKKGRFIGIVDFDVKYPKTVEYHHVPGIHTYKMNYADLFLANPCYALVEKFPFSSTLEKFNVDINDRMATTILYKE